MYTLLLPPLAGQARREELVTMRMLKTRTEFVFIGILIVRVRERKEEEIPYVTTSWNWKQLLVYTFYCLGTLVYRMV